MSLSRREQLLLDRLCAALRRTDPDLVAKFAVFRQVADGQPVPGHEHLPAGPGWPGWAQAALARLAHPSSRRHRPGHTPRPAQPAAGFPGLAQEDPMSTRSRISPLPPDQSSGGHSPLPPDPASDGHTSPLPPDPGLAGVPPLPRPRLAPDDQPSGGDPGDTSGRGPAGPR